MATNFTTIFDRAIYRFSEYSFLSMTTSGIEPILEKYLFSAQADFQGVCRSDLSRRTDGSLVEEAWVAGNYEADLSDEEIEILSLGICRYWLSAKILNSESLRNSLTVKDYGLYSPANLVRETTNLRNDIVAEYEKKIIKYSYSHGDIANASI